MKRWRAAALAVGLVLVMVPTLAPGPGSASTPPWCLICGERGGSDAIANTILFFPLGLALGFQTWSAFLSAAFGAGVTIAIETAQLLVIPGRDAGIGDLLFNTIGAILGIATARTANRWLFPGRQLQTSLQIGAGLAAAIIIIGTGWLFQPDLEAPIYRSQWAQWRSRRDNYQGTVHSVRLGDREIPDGNVEDPEYLQNALTTGAALTISGISGPPPRGFGAIYTIRARRNRDIWTAGQRGEDLIVHYRPRAADFRLQEPDLTIQNVLAPLAAGAPFTLSIANAPPGFTVVLNGSTYHPAFGAGDGWALLFYPIGIPRSARWILDYIWMTCLALPIGFWASRRIASVGGVAFLFAGLLLASLFSFFRAPGSAEIGGIVFGLLGGSIGRGAVNRFGNPWRGPDS